MFSNTFRPDMKTPGSPSLGGQRLGNRRRVLRTLLAAVLIVAFMRTWTWTSQKRTFDLEYAIDEAASEEAEYEYNDFQYMPLTGLVNDGRAGKRTCDEMKYEGRLRVQESFYLEDDLTDVARALEHHPMIIYPDGDKDLPYEEMVAKRWARLAGSSVWMEKYQVYLAVTRVIFFDKENRAWPIMSFLRGQLYDEDWNELKNHTIHWHGDEITFPTVFTIPAPYIAGGGFYGPEDPRIIIEEDVEDAEPVVVFNMVYELKDVTRAMHIFRPFSNVTTILSITGEGSRPMAEKNWAPFFHNDQENATTGVKKWPSHYIHFVHSFKPLKVLRCHALNGWCDIVYEQKVSEELVSSHDDGHGRMSGGTNLVPIHIPSSPGVHAYVGFPRSHIDVGCKDDAMYRPEMMIMTAHGSDFHLNYMSESIDFGTAALLPEAVSDPCGDGRILIANSVSRWDRSSGQDLMTISFSVADETVQVLRLQGVSRFIEELPFLGSALQHDMSQDGKVIWNLRWSAVGQDVLACSVEAAQNYSIAVAEPVQGWSRGKLREIQEAESKDTKDKDDVLHETEMREDEKEQEQEAKNEKINENSIKLDKGLNKAFKGAKGKLKAAKEDENDGKKINFDDDPFGSANELV
ncbi:Beta-mannosyltransferase 1 [Exophiala xenobiotica]|nr:Beta-mannosyltransferase 1 [Exophiala xenobiotica]KAK5543362.1 Beta-mannosyltransferase 1 [Chaetothyriales sp. CCFEE 6169]KAK5212165.1 Beta-mannosyltransferase 1 [Exophiala xenobiotica]KAK5249931.1 Beta-mannosyltransferase 1 [Exophiala xenobiotica]KAK5285503.1 Beta-mannosyltransferase 1 [Exophiala xenobiotica]